jgi:hypothetical protein
MQAFLFSLLILAFTLPASAIKVGKGRISLIDLGANIQSEISIAQKNYINVYALSADTNKERKSVLAIQGLVDKGETSFFVNTDRGIQNIQVSLDQSSSELETNNSNSVKVFAKEIKLKTNTSLIVTSPFYINDVVLASNPELLKIDPFSNYYDEDYLKNFIINAKDEKAKTEIIVPTTKKIFKFTIKIDDYKGGYDSAIHLI